jgi:hypothetical protein
VAALPALIIADESQLEAAHSLCSSVYEVFPTDTLADLSNRRVLYWENGASADEEVQAIANLPRSKDDAVKRIRGTKQASDFTDWATFRDWAVKNAEVIEPNSEAQTQMMADPPPPLPAADALEPESSSPASDPTDESELQGASLPDGDSHANSEPVLDDPNHPAWATPDEYEAPGSHGGWPIPLPIESSGNKARGFDVTLAPASIQPFLADCASRTGIDAGAYFVGALGAISGLCNDGYRLQPKLLDTRWRVHPSIWPIGVGDSSSGKTPGILEAMQFVQEIDIECEKRNIKARLDHQFELEKYDDAKRAARKANGPRPDAPDPVEIKQYWIDKATPEGVENALVTTRKLVWFMDEWSGLINGIDRYSSSGRGSGGREFVLSLYNGGPGKKTLSTGNSLIPNKSAVLCGGITPSAMLKVGSELESDGLLQRTFICMVRPMIAGRDAQPDERAYAVMQRIVHTLAEGHGEATLRMSQEAYGVYQEFCAQVLSLMRREENGPMASHLGKWAGMAPRMMLIYHLTELAAQGQQPTHGELISKRTAMQVCNLFMEWELSHLREFWHELMRGAANPATEFALIASRYILGRTHWDEPEPEVALRDIYSGYSGKNGKWTLMKPWERKEAFSMLEYAGWIAPKDEGRNKDGVPRTYLINPRIGSIMRDEIKAEVVRRAEARADATGRRVKE